MTNPMEIFTYTTGENAPEAHRAVALIHHANLNQIHPVLITGRDEDEVRRKAEEFWTRETERLGKRDGRSREARDETPAGSKPKTALELQMERRAQFFEEAREFGLDVPEGIDLRSREGRALKEALAAKKAEAAEPRRAEA